MSGFEIAGIALGAFPIVLAMLESQGKGWEKVDGKCPKSAGIYCIMTITLALLHHREEVRRFHVALNTEWVIFRDTCEQLLQNQMGEAAIERLFSPPASYATIDNGRQWNAVRNALKGRMRSRTVEAFIDNVHEMNRFLKELYSIYPQDTDYLAVRTDTSTLMTGLYLQYVEAFLPSVCQEGSQNHQVPYTYV